MNKEEAVDAINTHLVDLGDSMSKPPSEESDVDADVFAAPISAKSPSISQADKRKLPSGAYIWTPTSLSFDRVLRDRDVLPKIPLPSSKAISQLDLESEKFVLAEDEIASRKVLDGKILRETIHAFQNGMYFSYSTDATRNLQVKFAQNQHSSYVQKESRPSMAFEEPEQQRHLWQQADRRFFFNRWLSKPFMESKLDHFVYPVFQ